MKCGARVKTSELSTEGVMAVTVLPDSPGAFKDAVWEDVLPYYEELATRPLDTENVEQWLADWSRFDSLLWEAASLANFAYTCNTTDPELEAAQLRFGTQITPRAHEQRVRLQGRLVELGYMRPGLETMVERFRNQMNLFDEANVPLFAQLSELTTQWNKVNGAMTVIWEGEEKTPAQLLPFLQVNDRDVRERAFRLRAKPYIEQRDVLAGIFDRMYDLRQFIDHAAPVFGHVDPDFREYYQAMDTGNFLDLDNRKGKAPGGYCMTLPFSKQPLIFMNAVGVDKDLRTLLHESGHAFHAVEASRLPLLFQRFPGSEMAEVASMSMELLASPFIGNESGGYYSEADTRRSHADLLEGIIEFFPHCALVDAFQHWIYLDKAGRDADARDRKWLNLRRRFEGTSVDWTGLDSERVARWYQQPHFFGSPFYYIEYGIAQLGALQVWRNSRRDPKIAVRQYREALALGATRPLPELFQAAGARLIFDTEGMRELVTMVEEELDGLDA